MSRRNLPRALARCILVVALAGGALTPTAAAANRKHRPSHHAKAKTSAPKPNATASPAPRATTTVSPPAPPAVCPNAQASAANTPPAALRAAVICLLNQQRVSRGLPQLTENPKLDISAQFWTDEMVVTQVFWHGTDFTQRLAKVGYDWSNAGENIATGYATPQQAVVAWMASTEHCRNILNPYYADTGVGVNPAPVGTNVTDAATWTQDFGLTMAAPYPSSNSGPMSGCPYAV